MENKMLMPASCLALTADEMTYTTGGERNALEAVCAIVPFYGWYKGITAARDYRRAHSGDWSWIETGLDALTTDMEQSPYNLVYDVACAAWVAAVTATGVGAVVNLVILFT